MEDTEPKCVRLIVTAMYADGSSHLYDLKDPEAWSIGWNRIPDQSYFPPELTTQSSKTELEVRATVPTTSPCYISTYPVPKHASDFHTI